MELRSLPKKRIVLALVSALVFLALAILAYEVIASVRYDHWRESFDDFGWSGKITVPSENPVLMWEYRPYGEVGEIRTNRYGFRDRDLETTERPEGLHRVAFAGDSITLGMGIAFADTFVQRFEALANRADFERRVQALNFGVDGYNTLQVAELVRSRVLEYSPNMVVYVMCLNDFDLVDSSGVKTLYFRKPRSFFLKKLDAAYQRLFRVDFHRHHFRRSRRAVFLAIQTMRDRVEQAGAEFVVAVVPIFPRSQREWREYHLRDLHLEIARVLGAAGIRVVDLLDGFEAQGLRARELSQDVWHPNVAGNRIIAEELAAALL